MGDVDWVVRALMAAMVQMSLRKYIYAFLIIIAIVNILLGVVKK